MSGRLIITTKKTYCPWSQHNVERVLRDERLERERIEKEAKAEKDAAAAKRRGLHTDPNSNCDESQSAVQRHINLFPEAEEAELRLALGTTTSAPKKENGILPLPLGGEEASNRKMGRVPFYMQSRDAVDSAPNNNYVDRVLGRKVEGDAITGQIMRNQAVGRERSRKLKNDPMMRFYQSGECRDSEEGATSEVRAASQSTDEVVGGQSNHLEIDAHRDSDGHRESSKKRRHKSSKKGKKRKEKKHHDSSSAASDSSRSSISYRRHSKKERKRKHDRRHRDGQSSSHKSAKSYYGSTESQQYNPVAAGDETRDILRKKRLEREALENARAQSILGQSNSDNNHRLFGDRDRGYHDQWNPMLSRK
ncbi:hypothetical protein ACHAWO_003823 [Cyclotella atomus]|uniref:CBF1-interacting co-repressor CIR N-terminal domain-containing protein n=1 Tax=Cyclotella atomus TaxID=382360 RepID=A0ABD3QSS0_9STRA